MLDRSARTVVTHGLFMRQAVAMAGPTTLEDRGRRPLSRLTATFGSLTIALALAISTAAQLRSASDEAPPPPIPKAPEDAPAIQHEPLVEIESKFVELPTEVTKRVPPVPDKPTIYSDPQFQVIVRALSQKKGADLLSSPKVLTRTNQRATIEIIREFRYPTEWEKDGKGWKPAKFETKNVGVTLEVEPRIKEDGAIELHAIPSVVEFLGFVDLDAGNDARAPKAAPGDSLKIPPVTPGHRSKAIFSERKRDTTVTVKSDETVEIPDLPAISDVKPFEKSTHGRRLIVFISPRLIEAAPTKAFPKNGAAATTLAAVEASAAPASKPPLGLMTREWKIPPDMLPSKPGTNGPVPVFAKDWLISKGVIFGENATAIYVVAPSRLVVRNTQEQLDLVDQIVSAGTQDPGPAPAKEALKEGAAANDGAPAGEPAESPALSKAKKIIIPKIEFREATIAEALDFLRQKAVAFDPDKTGVNLVLKPGTKTDARITVSLTNIPLSEALRYVASLAGLELRAEPHALVLQPAGAGAR